MQGGLPVAYPSIPIVRFPLMFQQWRHLTFLHWRMPASAIRALVPPSLTVDEFDGSAWVGVTPFLLQGLRPPFVPPLPWLSQFPETNCRTYVREPDGQPAIWFFSLEAARVLAVMGARLGYGLPYAWARMQVELGPRIRYRSVRRWPDREATTNIEVEPGRPIEAGQREIFLTARFRLYSSLAGRLLFADVEHPPWPLQEARVIRAEQTLMQSAGLPTPGGLPLAHFSPGVAVRIGRPRFAASSQLPWLVARDATVADHPARTR
uniref:DUF2071 domain-containing protein n=1 Tax=Solibacter usitatus (strain Ellin6076) TaxID=234267 RepID=Q028C9_SOLUE